ncbi:MAG: hypothetical protein C5B56_00155 [Proteobacteria bacterium]|nr:MAG: hypothetical protein C5B56_00155 [Pseudomonadota bacterium]
MEGVRSAPDAWIGRRAGRRRDRGPPARSRRSHVQAPRRHHHHERTPGHGRHRVHARRLLRSSGRQGRPRRDADQHRLRLSKLREGARAMPGASLARFCMPPISRPDVPETGAIAPDGSGSGSPACDWRGAISSDNLRLKQNPCSTIRLEIYPMRRCLRELVARPAAARLCIVAAVVLASHAALAQTGRTIRLVVPVPAGASTDVIARLTAEQISRSRGVNMVIDNRPGAGGMIGTEFVSRAAPDGNTLIMLSNTYLIDAQMRKASYHPVTAFDPVCLLVESPAVFLVNGASPYATLKDLIDAARTRPGELSMAAIGPGSALHLGFINLTQAAGVSMTYVPYAGSAPAVTAALGQHVTSVFSGYAVVVEQMKNGALRALAAATSRRTDLLPDVPTFKEQGFPDLEVDNWFAVNAPANTPKPTLRQLIEWFTAAMDDPEVKAKVGAQGMYTVLTCGDEFGALIRKRYDEYGEAIRHSNLSRAQ